MSALAASTKEALSRRVRSVRTATRIPYLCSLSGIAIAFCSMTMLRDARSEAMSGSNVASRSSCRYGGSGVGLRCLDAKVASSPAVWVPIR